MDKVLGVQLRFEPITNGFDDGRTSETPTEASPKGQAKRKGCQH